MAVKKYVRYKKKILQIYKVDNYKGEELSLLYCYDQSKWFCCYIRDEKGNNNHNNKINLELNMSWAVNRWRPAVQMRRGESERRNGRHSEGKRKIKRFDRWLRKKNFLEYHFQLQYGSGARCLLVHPIFVMD